MPSELEYLEDVDAFKAAVNGDKVVVIDFQATWCKPCKMMGPKFVQFSDKFSNLACYKVDIDEAGDIAEECNVAKLPTFQVWKAGAMVDEMKGVDASKLEKLMESHNGLQMDADF